MSSFFRKILGVILLLSTIGLSTCQSMINVITDDTKKLDIEKSIGRL